MNYKITNGDKDLHSLSIDSNSVLKLQISTSIFWYFIRDNINLLKVHLVFLSSIYVHFFCDLTRQRMHFSCRPASQLFLALQSKLATLVYPLKCFVRDRESSLITDRLQLI